MGFSKRVLMAAAVFSGIFSVSKIINLFFINDFVSKNASTIGIIGGADGPTTIFLRGSNWFFDTIFRHALAILEIIVNTPRILVVAFNFAELVFFVCIFLYCIKRLLYERVKRM